MHGIYFDELAIIVNSVSSESESSLADLVLEVKERYDQYMTDFLDIRLLSS